MPFSPGTPVVRSWIVLYQLRRASSLSRYAIIYSDRERRREHPKEIRKSGMYDTPRRMDFALMPAASEFGEGEQYYD